MLSITSKIYAVSAIGGLLIAGFWAFHHFQPLFSIPSVEKAAAPELSAQATATLEKTLDSATYHIIMEKGTEPPFSSSLNEEKRPGTYIAADTGEPVFRSEQKFDSGTGWPSFWAPITPEAITLQDDFGFLGRRTEVLSRAGGHLGHVFDDGPAPTGKRYCINGLALRFIPDDPTR